MADINEVSNSSRPLNSITIEQAAIQSIEYIKKRKEGNIKSLRTPWKKFNYVGLNGLEWNTITTIAGLSGSGKTAILNELETALCELNPDENFEVLSFNFEMLARNLVSRKLSKALTLSTKELHSGFEGQALSDEQYDTALKEAKRLANYKIHYVDTPGSVLEIEKTILRHYSNMNKGREEHKGLVVLLDHSLLVKGRRGAADREMLMEIMEMFNSLKKITKTLFVIASQMNREIEQMERLDNPARHFPTKRDIFGGDGLYIYSDIVLVTMNPEYMGIERYGSKEWPVADIIYWHFIKVREGEPVIAKMKNKLKFNRVEDFSTAPTTRAINLNEVSETEE
jgi:replicative DNA helicase